MKIKKNSQYTAWLLLLFLAYSIFIQNLHILFHDHGDIHNPCNHGQTGIAYFCTSENVCGHSSGYFNHENNPDHLKQPGINKPEHPAREAVQCPVCEHKFAKFSISKIISIDFSLEILSFVTPCLYQAPRIMYKGNHVSLRAPPSIF